MGPLRIIRARYDAAVTNDENRRHWAAADGLSARQANSEGVRRILRNRARYEFANNCHCHSLVRGLSADSVGSGPRLQLLTSDADTNRRIEQMFQTWARTMRLAEKLRLLRTAQPLRTPDEVQRIHDTFCKSCEEFDGKACTKCGCGIKREGTFLNKLAWGTEKCPLGKW